MALDRLAKASASPAQQAADLAAAKTAISAGLQIHRDALAGKEVPPPYDGVSGRARQAATAKDQRAAELGRRAAQDQLTRMDWSAAQARQAWAAGLSENALQYAFAMVGRDGCGVDQANTAWLKGQLNEIGWFTISRFGKEADAAAWLLVQHADQDRAFQGEVLAKLESLTATGETDKRNYAYLFDRVAQARGGPQRYGTQGRCVGPGAWEPFPVEAPDQLDARRTSIGLMTEAEYKAFFKNICAGADPQPPAKT